MMKKTFFKFVTASVAMFVGIAAFGADDPVPTETVSCYVSGLKQARLAVGYNESGWTTMTLDDSSIPVEVVPGTGMADTQGSWTNPFSGNSFTWTDGTTFLYAGEMYLENGKTYTFGKFIDDAGYIKINGTVVLNHTTYNSLGTGSYKHTAATGWYPAEFRPSDGSGGKGPYGDWAPNMGFGYNTSGITAALPLTNWTKLYDPGDMTLFRTESTQPLYVTLGGKVTKSGSDLNASILVYKLPGAGKLYAKVGATEVLLADNIPANTLVNAAYAIPGAASATSIQLGMKIAGNASTPCIMEWSNPIELGADPSVEFTALEPGYCSLNATVNLKYFGFDAESVTLTAEYSENNAFTTFSTVDLGTVTSAGSVTKNIPSLTTNKRYYVRIKAVTNTGKTVTTAVRNATTMPPFVYIGTGWNFDDSGLTMSAAISEMFMASATVKFYNGDTLLKSETITSPQTVNIRAEGVAPAGKLVVVIECGGETVRYENPVTKGSSQAVVSSLAELCDPETAPVLAVGGKLILPELKGSAALLNKSAHRLLSITDNVITALDEGIGAIKVTDESGANLGEATIFIKPVNRPVDRVFIWKGWSGSDQLWSKPANWRKYGSPTNGDVPDGEHDIAFVPCTQANSTLNVDGSYRLTGLYYVLVSDLASSGNFNLRGKVTDGSASLTFYGAEGKIPGPAKFMAASMSTSNTMNFYPRGSGTDTKITFRVGKGTLELDCGGPVNKIKSSSDSSHVMRWHNDNVNGCYDIPEGCTLRLVNGIRYGSFGDDQMGSEVHVNIGAADIFTGSGLIELASCSAVSLGNFSLRSFHGTVRSQSLNFVRGRNSNRSCIVWTEDVSAPDVSGEINGFCTREFTAAYGVGAWGSGNSHGYGGPDKILGTALPGKKLEMNGGILQLLGLNKTGSDTSFWKRPDNAYEGHYETSELVVGKGLSYIDNGYNAARSGNGAISHFIADTVTHSDPCGTLRVSDGHFRNAAAFGAYRSETTLTGISNHIVGYNGAPNYSNNIFPIVPWAIGNSDGNADNFWWLGFDANGNVIRNGNRTNIDRNNMQPNQNAYVNGNIDIVADKEVNSLLLRDSSQTKTLGAGRKLTIASGALGLEANNTSLGTQTGGNANGMVVFSEKAFVFATASSDSQPNQIWSTIIAEKGFVSGYCGQLLLAGDQSGIKGELTVNNGTLQLGSMDGTVACQLGGVTEVRAIGGNTVLRINKEGALDNKTVRFECPGGFGPKFQLQNTEQEHCYKLYIDGQSIRSGTWGATGSGAANVDDEHFSGPGVLVVQRDDVGIGFSMVFRP